MLFGCQIRCFLIYSGGSGLDSITHYISESEVLELAPTVCFIFVLRLLKLHNFTNATIGISPTLLQWGFLYRLKYRITAKVF